MKISLIEATQLLKNGCVAAVPTETVYGMAASLTQLSAIDQIFRLKGRPSNNPLIIHLASFYQLTEYVSVLPEGTERLAHSFWPGPLTLVLPCNLERVPSQVRAGLPTAAFRIPNHPLTLELLHAVGPLVMPSANLSGRPSATCRKHVETDFGQDFPVLDGGCCSVGVESTILYFGNGGWQVIRLGALPAEAFAPILGYVPDLAIFSKERSPLCPGQFYRHYAPKAKLLLSEELGSYSGIVLGFSGREYPVSCRVISLGSLDSSETVAENLYGVLRQLDQEHIETAWVDMDFPKQGLWLTIEERLRKAGAS